jgi:hypothetical protein
MFLRERLGPVGNLVADDHPLAGGNPERRRVILDVPGGGVEHFPDAGQVRMLLILRPNASRQQAENSGNTDRGSHWPHILPGNLFAAAWFSTLKPPPVIARITGNEVRV